MTACDDKRDITAPAAITIAVTPNPSTLAVGATQQFTAVGKSSTNGDVAITPTWSVVSGGGTISSTGVFTAGTVPGAFASTVKATSNGVSAFATVNVTPGAIATITVTPTPVTLARSATQQYTAVAKDAFGNVVTFTPTWSIASVGGGTINTTGLFTAGTTAGTFTNAVVATSGSISGAGTVIVTPGALATITVTPNPATLASGATQQFTAVGKDASGNAVVITPAWTAAAGTGTIGASSGLFTAGTTGTFTNGVIASSGGITGFANVTVTAGPLATITVTPNPVSVAAGATQTFTAVGKDAAGNIVTITPSWTVSSVGGGTIAGSTGVYTAGPTAGTFTNSVVATSGSISGTATVTVTTTPVVPPVGALATITVSPNPANLAPNGQQTFTAVGKDAAGNIVSITPVWTISAAGGGTIGSSTGLYTAGAATGTFTNSVVATSGTVSGSATVNVTTVVVPPSGGTINLGAAAANGIMAGTAVSCVNLGAVNADISISPGNTLTGFGPCTVSGTKNLNNAIAQQAQIDLTTAYNTLAGMACPAANAIIADLGGTTKPAGVYCSTGSIGVTGTLTLDGGGDPNATFVFQAGSSLTTAGSIVLINGAQAKNVYWKVGSSATIGTASAWKGNIIALTSISLIDNATLIGRALARTGAVSLTTGNIINLP